MPLPNGQSVAQVSVNRTDLDSRPTSTSVHISGNIDLQSADATSATVTPISDEMFRPLPTCTANLDVDLFEWCRRSCALFG